MEERAPSFQALSPHNGYYSFCHFLGPRERVSPLQWLSWGKSCASYFVLHWAFGALRTKRRRSKTAIPTPRYAERGGRNGIPPRYSLLPKTKETVTAVMNAAGSAAIYGFFPSFSRYIAAVQRTIAARIWLVEAK